MIPVANPLSDLVYANQIRALLSDVLDQRDRQIAKGKVGRLQAIRITPEARSPASRRLMAAFVDAKNVDDAEFWAEIKLLCREFGCFELEINHRRRAWESEWQGASLLFKDSTEELVRAWLDRPRSSPLDKAWGLAVSRYRNFFENPAALPEKRQELPAGFGSYDELLTCWASAANVLKSIDSISWRQLSSRCFLADSKFLDSVSRQTLLGQLFPTLSRKLNDRPVLLHLYVPERIEQVIIIENQDTFLALVELRPSRTALVNGAGYRVSAARIREAGLAHFSLQNRDASDLSRLQFEAWWLKAEVRDWPIFFWGDLDFAGLDIAASLKRSFPSLECWQPGYLPMVDLLQSGGGHLPIQADKERQRLVSTSTGCAFADQIMVPALYDYGRFVDQEWVNLPVADI
jgi:Wadjet protein JetD, C-terminal